MQAMTTTVSRSLFRRGQAQAIAMAAEAPQMPTAPPDNTPNRASAVIVRASSHPKPIVPQTARITIATVGQLSAPICWKVTRSPSSATLMRSSVRAEKLIPSA